MEVTNPADGTLSASMQQVLREHPEPVDAAWLVNRSPAGADLVDVLRHHLAG